MVEHVIVYPRIFPVAQLGIPSLHPLGRRWLSGVSSRTQVVLLGCVTIAPMIAAGVFTGRRVPTVSVYR